MLNLLRALRDGVMPLRCAFCGEPTTDAEGSVCDGCRSDLPGATVTGALAPLASTVAPFAYEFPVDAAIKALKFRRKLFYGAAFGELLCDSCGALPDDIDAVLPVPLHWRRHGLRGFNQALEIGRPVARRLGVPVIQSVSRCRATRSQAGLSAAERASNLRSAFIMRGDVRSGHVLIVDDVITTGATVRQIARSLLEAGAEKVSALAVARA